MSYFDHVQCHSCGARMDPEQLAPGRGEMPACPYCGASLNLADLFGVKDSFVGLDDERGNDHSLDDLVGGELYDGRYPDGRAPGPSSGATPGPRQSRRSTPAAARGSGGRGALRALTGPASAGANALVPRNRPDDEELSPRPSPGGGSALDLLREMKKKR